MPIVSEEGPPKRRGAHGWVLALALVALLPVGSFMWSWCEPVAVEGGGYRLVFGAMYGNVSARRTGWLRFRGGWDVVIELPWKSGVYNVLWLGPRHSARPVRPRSGGQAPAAGLVPGAHSQFRALAEVYTGDDAKEKLVRDRPLSVSGRNAMTLQEALELLERHGQPRVRELNITKGAPENHFGVKMGDIRAIARTIKFDHDLGLQLWESGNVDAMLLATLVLRPRLLSDDEVEAMVASVTYAWLADWLMTHVVKQHPSKETLRLRWMASEHPMLSRAGWSLTTERVIKNPDGIEVGALLDRLDREMGSAPAPAQWTMNFCLAEIGIRFAEHRQRAVAIGERLGLYRDYPVSKGCTSPFAPIWIAEMVARQQQL